MNAGPPSTEPPGAAVAGVVRHATLVTTNEDEAAEGRSAPSRSSSARWKNFAVASSESSAVVGRVRYTRRARARARARLCVLLLGGRSMRVEAMAILLKWRTRLGRATLLRRVFLTWFSGGWAAARIADSANRGRARRLLAGAIPSRSLADAEGLRR